MYRIIRRYDNGKTRTIRKGLSLEEAKLHCSNPKTSSSTGGYANYNGQWFDSFAPMPEPKRTVIRGEEWEAILKSDGVCAAEVSRYNGQQIYKLQYHNLWYYYIKELSSGYLSLNTLKRRIV